LLKIVNNAIILHEMRSIDEMLSEMDFDSNKLVCISDNFYLTNYQISILEKYHFNYLNYSNYNELTKDIDEVLNDDYFEDLDDVLNQIIEFNYYHNTNK